jgi:peptidoglycan/xylan/chitin deacetylase (PgdA/CDA1 family)
VSERMDSPLPFLITLDLELARDHDLMEQREALTRMRADLTLLGARSTVFTTAEAAELFAEELGEWRELGHEIGCHGLDHAPAEDYRRATLATAREWIAEASERIERALGPGSRPRCFRGPRMETSPATQQALLAEGYLADFSVCPGRFDAFACQSFEPGWLLAPRTPYRPCWDSPFRRGSFPLWVVPTSALGAPFSSGARYVAGSWLFAAFTELLALEARLRGGALVYLFHSYEFASRNTWRPDDRPWHQRIYPRDPARRYRANLRLLERLLAQADVEPFTATEYLERLEGRPLLPVATEKGRWARYRAV